MLFSVSDHAMNTPKTAKIFMSGRSQAVRLPLAYRFDTDEVYIRKDEMTGDIILSTKQPSSEDWADLLAVFAEPEYDETQQRYIDEFSIEKQDGIQNAQPFEDWAE